MGLSIKVGKGLVSETKNANYSRNFYISEKHAHFQAVTIYYFQLD